jgi:hypothetical protein
MDFNGASLAELEDEIQFKQARTGNYLCVPFQCPNCQSQNLQGKSIDPSHVEDLVLKCMIIRATLDALWSWATKTFEKLEIWLAMAECLAIRPCLF